MKYKVGDKIKIVRATAGCYGAEGKIGTVTNEPSTDGLSYNRDGFNVDCGYGSVWRIGFESECELLDELTVEEAIRLQAEMCTSIACKDCAIDRLRCDSRCGCDEFRSKNPDKVLEVLKQWKKDHEKKEVETERAIMVRVLIGNDCNGKCVHEEEVPSGETWERAQERVLKEYCENHEGKYISTICGICRVKE